MGKIFCIMGKSSSGKDTIYKKIVEMCEINLKSIILYTTRPIREGETNGVEYIFTDEVNLEEIKTNDKLIELREYNTMHGIWKYFMVNDEQIDLEKFDYAIIGTIESFVSMVEYFGKNIVVPIFIEVEDGERLERALEREKKQKFPKYEEMCRRFLADSKDFAEEKKIKAEIKKSFFNIDVEKCLQEIIEFIKIEVENNSGE